MAISTVNSMPDTRKHRGPHPKDGILFGEDARADLVQASIDYTWLLSRGYPADASLKLIGDRFQLTARQRLAVRRGTCSQSQRENRLGKRSHPNEIQGQTLAIDAFNLITTVEAAFSDGVLLEGSDSCWRDMASMHGSYRRVAETVPAIEHIGRILERLAPVHCRWLIDRPVSNSGRLREMLLAAANAQHWEWSVELDHDADVVLLESADIVCTADSMILDGCSRWLNLARIALESRRDHWWLVSFEVPDEK
ncbi:MAG TPA: DUF434 domain-containing protein [Planctomycetes bacterium]|nr:DUF434 domain-containing protein [Planctomycetota bacterium]